MCSRSFGYRITEYADMRQAVCTYAERAAAKLRSEHQFCAFVSVFYAPARTQIMKFIMETNHR
jgi:hypothetical protein